MPRPHRIVVAGLPHHATQRGNNRMPIFLDDSDSIKCRELLLAASLKYECAIHHYVLMGNHLHLLATPQRATSLSRMMQSVELNYARYFNERYERTGTLWEGRFRSAVIESGRYYFTCGRYIEMNPVRALLVDHPGSYRWTSFHCNATGGADSLVTPHPLYDELGTDAQSRRMAYLALFPDHLDPETCDALRRATRRRSVFGSAQFITDLEAMLKCPVQAGPHGGRRQKTQQNIAA